MGRKKKIRFEPMYQESELYPKALERLTRRGITEPSEMQIQKMINELRGLKKRVKKLKNKSLPPEYYKKLAEQKAGKTASQEPSVMTEDWQREQILKQGYFVRTVEGMKHHFFFTDRERVTVPCYMVTNGEYKRILARYHAGKGEPGDELLLKKCMDYEEQQKKKPQLLTEILRLTRAESEAHETGDPLKVKEIKQELVKLEQEYEGESDTYLKIYMRSKNISLEERKELVRKKHLTDEESMQEAYNK